MSRSYVKKAVEKCKNCGGGKTHHTLEPECWCPGCLRLPEEERCRDFEPIVESTGKHHEKPRVDKRVQADIIERRKALPRVGTFRRMVWDQIGRMGGATDDELEYALGKSHQSVSAARNSLMEDDLIRDSGEKRPTRYDNEAIVWVINVAENMGVEMADAYSIARRILQVEWGRDHARTPEVESCFDDAIADVRRGAPFMQRSYYGVKSYDAWPSQRADCQYGYGPSHGSIWFRIGLRSRTAIEAVPLDETDRVACVRYLTALRDDWTLL